ncbi:MAG: hypothetical protein LBQ57_06860 [Spirochaetales bacterium]|jgi:hypothetical protein|nr:hypothetical protein [Spirochaetales bacterium]
MNEASNEIKIAYTDTPINTALASLSAAAAVYTRHFSQNEEFFLKLSGAFTVPAFLIHHDVRENIPGEKYLKNLRPLILSVAELAPDIFRGLTYFFNPADILHPAFYRVYTCGQKTFLFLLRVDLQWKAREHTLLSKGDNSTTAVYSSDKIFLEADIIPLESVVEENGKIAGFCVQRSISQTWVDERGSGYFLQGIWIDTEITKFFTRLFLPGAKRIYPYYPFTCKHRAVCLSLVQPEEKNRERLLPLLHQAQEFLEPHIPAIETALRREQFSEKLEVFTAIKAQVPDRWQEIWSAINVTAYLNDADMKEFKIEISEN